MKIKLTTTIITRVTITPIIKPIFEDWCVAVGDWAVENSTDVGTITDNDTVRKKNHMIYYLI